MCTNKKGGMLCHFIHSELVELVTQVFFSFTIHILYFVTRDNGTVEFLIDLCRRSMRTEKNCDEKER